MQGPPIKKKSRALPLPLSTQQAIKHCCNCANVLNQPDPINRKSEGRGDLPFLFLLFQESTQGLEERRGEATPTLTRRPQQVPHAKSLPPHPAPFSLGWSSFSSPYVPFVYSSLGWWRWYSTERVSSLFALSKAGRGKNGGKRRRRKEKNALPTPSCPFSSG